MAAQTDLLPFNSRLVTYIWKPWTNTKNTQEFLGKTLVKKSDYASESEQNNKAKLLFDTKIHWCVLPASQACDHANKPWANDWLRSL